ncbi:DUF2092 domain-containing protein [Methylocystis heyeri]|uniref:DUF2092 domain-containing protein n=1 Tax=Methylocystis heyeri TaxID=391905 RepID=A0A6B8KG61_9HYPH|nr:DUF2092 domain-containing protein [Methylocystis heyeri]QGM45473.1 DUF2092 domain-containing protein [Methylocystis heyeri]
MKRISYILLSAALATCLAAPLRAETPQAPAATSKAPEAIAPAALNILKEMSETLAKAKSLSFSVRRAFDEPASNGQPLFYMVDSRISLRRPDQLKVEVLGDGPKSEFYYDGKEFAVYLPASNLIAVETAPPHLEEMLEAAYSKAGIYFPFVDFIVDDPYAAITEKLTSAFVMGKSEVVGGTTTDIIAIANKDFQAQLWIGAKDKLPRLVWLNPTNGKEKSRSMIEFSNWRLGAAKLNFARAPGSAKAGRIKFEKPGEAHSVKR